MLLNEYGGSIIMKNILKSLLLSIVFMVCAVVIGIVIPDLIYTNPRITYPTLFMVMVIVVAICFYIDYFKK